MLDIIKRIIAKYGWKTALGTILASAGQLAPAIPALAPYSGELTAVGLLLGGVGLIHKDIKQTAAVAAVVAGASK